MEKNSSADWFDEKSAWCPDVCPITLRPFFMWIHHPEHGWLPTYGGPYDSYTIPEPDLEGKEGTTRDEIEYYCLRFDHDDGGWLLGDRQDDGFRVISEDRLWTLIEEASTTKQENNQ